LRSAIAFSEVRRDARGVFVDVGVTMQDLANASGGDGTQPTANYAVFVEYGTTKMRAQPFMRPALAEASGGSFPMRYQSSAEEAA
jgi:HK97 gp10 family phage protein